MIQTLDLFPQKIGRFRYEGDLSLYVDEIYRIKSQVPNNVKEFPELCYQTPMDLFDKYPIFSPIHDFIKQELFKFKNIPVDIFNSWANIYPMYGYSQYHTHGWSHLSGVLYLQIPSDNHRLFIYSKHDYNLRYPIQPKVGDIIFFEGDQPHATSPNFDKKEKVIISFNLNFTDSNPLI